MTPNEDSYVVADIPGLIEGAHLGAGLGVQFLRHIERTRVLVHLVDVSDASGRPDPVEDFKVIQKELESFGHGLDEKPMLVVASKSRRGRSCQAQKTAGHGQAQEAGLLRHLRRHGEGVDTLKYAIAKRVFALREAEFAQEKPVLPEFEY